LTNGTDEGTRPDAPDQVDSSPTSPDLGRTLLRVAWLAIALGLAMEALLLLLGASFGELLGVKSIVADLAKNLSWSLFVCTGLAVGTAASQARAPAMGLMGLLAAPVAFEVSRVVHKGTLEALEISGGADTSPVLVAVIKGFEYGCLGLAVGWLGRRPWGGAAAHAAAGLAVGLVFGGAIVALTVPSGAQMSVADLVSRGVNEVLFPLGCSLVLYTSVNLGERMTRRN
jgi:predicted secreted protein